MGDNKSIKPNTTPYKIIEVFSQGKHKALTGSDEHIMQEFKDFLYNMPLLKTDKIDPIKVATGKMLSKADKENIKNLNSTNLNIDLKEINFKTMESKLHESLYFAGEIVNIDAITGGFNFQNAWTSGYIVACALS